VDETVKVRKGRSVFFVLILLEHQQKQLKSLEAYFNTDMPTGEEMRRSIKHQ
jgi:hypothetical protein